MDVDYVVRDTIETLRPKLKMYTSYEEAVTATEQMEQELKAKIGKCLFVKTATCFYPAFL